MILKTFPLAPALPITQARRSTTDGAQGFHDGAGLINDVYDKYDEIKIWRT
ncbi:MAG: hypothetical protein ABOK23_03110 [Candidatus Methanoperedens sp.]|nr:hypothetical protein [Candidatus Methanoperedens sp.]